jgi:hypothetical protein
MYRAGYIHRDISVGNIILLSRKSNRSGYHEDVGVLIDLEYAKKFLDDARSLEMLERYVCTCIAKAIC